MRQWRNQRGDTLVEVMIALVILTAVLVSALSVSRLTRVGSANSGERAQTLNLVQEQYEALKYYRDHNTWGTTLGNTNNCKSDGTFAAGCTGVGIMTYNNNSAGADCDTNTAGTQYCFHMERQSNPVLPNYGQWVTCPGPWYPPSGVDSAWNATPTGNETNTGVNYYYNWYSIYGCRGSYRNQNNPTNPQKAISVAIYFQPTNGTLADNIARTTPSPLLNPSTGTSYICTGSNSSPAQSLNFVIRGTWASGGSNASTSTNLTTTIANIVEQPSPC